MLNNHLAASLRHLARNPVYSGIGILGLAVGLCAALLTSLVVRNQLGYDRFIPGYERTYLASTVLVPSGQPPMQELVSPSWLAVQLKSRFPEIETIGRILEQDTLLRHADIEGSERVYWADPGIFSVLPLPALHGNPATALQRPDGIALTRSMARKYFGRDDVIGGTLLLDGAHLMKVTAILQDLPANGTRLKAGIFASGRAAHSPLARQDADPYSRPYGEQFSINVQTYVRLARDARVDSVQQAFPQLMRTFWPRRPPGIDVSLQLVRLDRVNLSEAFNPGIASRLAMMAAVGALVLLAACIVFINLTTAHAARRAMEVSMRKALGASRGSLIFQFLVEALLHVTLATCIALALVELLLPPVNAFLQSGARLDYRHDPALISWLGAGVLLLGAVAGAYPALVLSSFRPGAASAQSAARPGGTIVRQALVAMQFAVLIGLIIAAGVIHQQRLYATRDALRVNADQVLIVRSPCHAAFVTGLRALPGVIAARCSTEGLLAEADFGNCRMQDGGTQPLQLVGVEPGLFELYGLSPLAGNLLRAQNDGAASPGPVRYVINEAAARRLGFSSPTAAIGKILPVAADDACVGADAASEIVGVVSDFSMDAGRQIKPTLYYPERNPDRYSLISLKLNGHGIPETLAQMEHLWKRLGLRAPQSRIDRSEAAMAREPMDRFFLDDYIQGLYVSVLRQAQGLGAFAGVAVLLSCLGLTGLAASATERRTKEIGIRKATGARSRDVVFMLLWQFAKPVLWANAIAWPVTAFFMQRWLEGFAYHVEFPLWLFPAASVVALLLALLTVGAHSMRVARRPPVEGLRHE